jgi:hypothetical protein
MIVTVTPKGITGKDGKMKMITIKAYHCESCRSFVRSMDEENRTASVVVIRVLSLPSCSST